MIMFVSAATYIVFSVYPWSFTCSTGAAKSWRLCRLTESAGSSVSCASKCCRWCRSCTESCAACYDLTMYSSRATIDSPYLRTQIAVVAAVGQRLKSAVVAGRNHHHFQMRFCQTLQGGISKEWYQGRSGLKNSTRFCSSEEKNRRRPGWKSAVKVSHLLVHTHTHTLTPPCNSNTTLYQTFLEFLWKMTRGWRRRLQIYWTWRNTGWSVSTLLMSNARSDPGILDFQEHSQWVLVQHSWKSLNRKSTFCCLAFIYKPWI